MTVIKIELLFKNKFIFETGTRTEVDKVSSESLILRLLFISDEITITIIYTHEKGTILYKHYTLNDQDSHLFLQFSKHQHILIWRNYGNFNQNVI